MNYNLCDEFINYKKYLGYRYKTDTIVMNEIKKYLEDNNIKTITKEVVGNYARINLNLKPNTLARNIGVFREFCKYLKMQDIDCYQIPKKLYPQKARQYVPYIFSDEEIKLIFKNLELVASSANKHYSYIRSQTIPLIIRVLYQTGMRVGEVLNLKIDDYNKEDGYFKIKQSKNKEERIIYLPDSLNKRVLSYHIKFHQIINNKYFFQLTKTKIDTNTIERNFYESLKLSNIIKTDKGPRLHDLRHTFIVRSIEKAFEEEKDFNQFLPYLQAYVGHSSLKALEYYFRLTNVMIEKLNPLIEDKLGNIIPKVGDINE